MTQESVNKKTPESLWHTWSKDPSVDNSESLLGAFRPMIHKEVSRHSGLLPQSFLEAEAKRLTFTAFESYKPSIGKLSTHVGNKLRGIGRVNYTYQNSLRMPEARQRKYTVFSEARQKLEEDFGREPSMQELSEELKWPINEVGRMIHDVHRETSPVNTDSTPVFDDSEKFMVDYIYQSLHPEEKVIFEGITGYMGHPIIKPVDLAKKLKLSESQFRRRRDKLVEKIQWQISK